MLGQCIKRVPDQVFIIDVGWSRAKTCEPRRALPVVGEQPMDISANHLAIGGDRTLGLARWQYDKVHAGMVYDLELDTSTATPDELAERIKLTFGL